ncbi:MAG: hypothetical protein KA314_11550 [Chloroflexi bacterium]|nr:hypothetical protein [Chloroflexota bacterium]MBP8056469.1 hypothetical protein [Chloroflexota bacterium]
MNEHTVSELWQKQRGIVTVESYSTAWLGLTPAWPQTDRPAWPEAINTVRLNQLVDGGWGEGSVYYAHDRLISTLAALQLLKTWNDPQDEGRIERGLAVLPQYAQALAQETVEPIGFELLLPALATELENLGLPFPYEAWIKVSETTKAKLALVGKLEVDPQAPKTWWFSMEMLPVERLAKIDERVLDRYGAIATSAAATTAYLRACRLQGRDVPVAAAYLNRVVQATGGGAGVTYPIDVFELAWTLDNLRRAGLRPSSTVIASMLWRLMTYWEIPPLGVTWNLAFRVRDGDHPAVAYKVLRWAGLHPSDRPLLDFWNEEAGLYMTYLDERGTSLSTTVHGLTAFRDDPGNKAHRRIAVRLTEWLRKKVMSQNGFQDKWHYSPLYTAARLLPVLIGWDDDLARYTAEYILQRQRIDGGWGCSTGYSNLEETGLAALALTEAYTAGLFKDVGVLAQAQAFLHHHNHELPRERLWIGKSLYLPIGVVQSVVFSAQWALARTLAETVTPYVWPVPHGAIWQQAT